MLKFPMGWARVGRGARSIPANTRPASAKRETGTLSAIEIFRDPRRGRSTFEFPQSPLGHIREEDVKVGFVDRARLRYSRALPVRPTCSWIIPAWKKSRASFVPS